MPGVEPRPLSRTALTAQLNGTATPRPFSGSWKCLGVVAPCGLAIRWEPDASPGPSLAPLQNATTSKGLEPMKEPFGINVSLRDRRLPAVRTIRPGMLQFPWPLIPSAAGALSACGQAGVDMMRG